MRSIRREDLHLRHRSRLAPDHPLRLLALLIEQWSERFRRHLAVEELRPGAAGFAHHPLQVLRLALLAQALEIPASRLLEDLDQPDAPLRDYLLLGILGPSPAPEGLLRDTRRLAADPRLRELLALLLDETLFLLGDELGSILD